MPSAHESPPIRRRRSSPLTALVTLVAFSASAVGTSRLGAQAPPSGASDSALVVAAVERFHQALAAGDSVAALALLAPDVVVLESGDLETLADYRAHHLPADIAFARAVPSTRTLIRAVMQGDAAWVTSTSSTRGTYRDRPIDSAGAELVVLAREPGGWRIRAVHWSSHARRPAR